MAEKPTSSSTTYTTLAAPSGALGGSKGDQSGTESRMSTLILPLNGLLITLSSVDPVARHPVRDGCAQRRVNPSAAGLRAHHPVGTKRCTPGAQTAGRARTRT